MVLVFIQDALARDNVVRWSGWVKQRIVCSKNGAGKENFRTTQVVCVSVSADRENSGRKIMSKAGMPSCFACASRPGPGLGTGPAELASCARALPDD